MNDFTEIFSSEASLFAQGYDYIMNLINGDQVWCNQRGEFARINHISGRIELLNPKGEGWL